MLNSCPDVRAASCVHLSRGNCRGRERETRDARRETVSDDVLMQALLTHRQTPGAHCGGSVPTGELFLKSGCFAIGVFLFLFTV